MTGNQRRHYPPNWPELAQACKVQANWRCQHCGVEQFAIRESRRGVPYFVYLAACHRFHDKHNPNPELVCLCVSCHAKHDFEHRQQEARVALERLRHQIALQSINDFRCYGG